MGLKAVASGSGITGLFHHVNPLKGYSPNNIIQKLLAISNSLTFYKDFRNTTNLTAYGISYTNTVNAGSIILTPFDKTVSSIASVAVTGTKEYMMDGRQMLINKNGLITGIDNLYLEKQPASIRLRIWRERAFPGSSTYMGDIFDLVSTSEDFAASSVGGILNNITFLTPITGGLSCFFSLLVTPMSPGDLIFATTPVNVHDAKTVTGVSTIDGTFTVDTTGFTNAQIIAVYSLGGSLPTGWSDAWEAQNQYLKIINATTGQLYTSAALTTPIIPSTAGSGTIKLCSNYFQTKMWIYSGTAPDPLFSWRFQPYVSQVCVPCQLKGASPTYVMTGDSLMAGYSNYYPQETVRAGGASFYQDQDTQRFNQPTYLGDAQTMEGQLEVVLGITVINAGIGGDNSAYTLARWDTDVTPYNPRVIIYRVSPNDITQGYTQAQTLANLQAMYVKAVAIGARLYIGDMLPDGALTNTQCVDRDNRNIAAQALVANWTYGGWLSASYAVGIPRVGGSPTPPAGNLWDVNPIYINPLFPSDLVHYGPNGYRAVSNAYAPQIQALDTLGSAQGQFTATRSASAPATYYNSSGVLQKVITSDTPRFTQGYYDTTGFHALPGLLMEPASKNWALRSDGTAYSGGLMTAWTPVSGVTGTPVNTTPLIPDLSSIPNAASQRVQYTGIVTDTGNRYLFTAPPATGTGTFAQNDVIRCSFKIRSQTGNSFGNIRAWLRTFDAAVSGLDNAILTLTGVNSQWKQFTLSITAANVNTSQCAVSIGGFAGILGGSDTINNGQTVDFEVADVQYEKNVLYASSFIPTTTVGLSRNAEKLVYGTTDRTAATETIFIKASPNVAASDLFAAAALMDTDTKERLIQLNTDNTVSAYGNLTDSATSVATTSSALAINTSIMLTTTMLNTGNPNIQNYLSAAVDGAASNVDFIVPAWGSYFYIGSKNDGSVGAPAIYQDVAIYGSVLSGAQITQVANIIG